MASTDHIFTVIDGDLKNLRFSGIVRPIYIKEGKFYRWITNILGYDPDDEFSTDDMLGKTCMIYLSKKKNFYSVTDVSMLKDL